MRRERISHNEELRDFYYSPNIIRIIKARGVILERRMGEMRNADTISVREPGGTVSLGDLAWVGEYENVVWTQMPHGRVHSGGLLRAR
jgi:hypothetical protein